MLRNYFLLIFNQLHDSVSVLVCFQIVFEEIQMLRNKPPLSPARKIYFAHPINTYHTAIEEEFLGLIRQKFMGYSIVNPSDSAHKIVVDTLKKNNPDANVMAYFRGLVSPCYAVAVLPFPDGMWGAGVWSEAEIALAHKKEVWVFDYHSKTLAFLNRLEHDYALSIEETKARVYNLPERTIRPYI